MMKKLGVLLGWLVVGLSTAYGQTLKSSGTSAEDVLPDGWVCISAYGDMNQDGIKDMALIALPPRRNMDPLLAVYWGKGGNRYSLWRVYEALSAIDDDNAMIDYALDVTAKGVLRLDQTTSYSSGSWSNYNDSFMFRFQQGDFFLIGEEHETMARNTGIAEKQSFNYLTHKQQTQKYSVMKDVEFTPTEQWKRLPKKPLQSLSKWHN